MSKKCKNVCMALNFIEQLFALASAVTGCVSIFTFTFSVSIPIGIMSSAVGLKICAITAGIKKCKSIIKKKNKKHEKIVLLAKTKSNSIEVLISKTLIVSYYISLNEFV